MKEFEGLTGIREYLNSQEIIHKIDVKGIPHIVEAIEAKCGISKEHAERILSLFFNEIRYCMLTGKVVVLNTLGKFYIKSPKVANSKHIVPCVRFSKSLLEKINEE